MPGPNKPSLSQINHGLAPLVDDLLLAWDPGFFFTRMHLYPSGHLCQSAVIPLVCDIMGVRQAGGFAGPTNTIFCSCCFFTRDRIEEFKSSEWSMRSCTEHRQFAEKWRDAQTVEEQRDIVDCYGVRYSEPLRLPYWNPVLFTVLDSMHTDFLLKLHHHMRNIWGADPSLPLGEGYQAPTTHPTRPSDSALATVLGREVLEEVWKDQERTQLPSFMTAAPKVAADKRTPTADHWRSIGLIHLVITLIRLWGQDERCKGDMLHNYMHLVMAIHISNMQSMLNDKIDLYSYHYKKYFCGVLDLHKEARIRPVHHMGFHYDMLLRAFGPVHSWWAWAFERFNYTLQNIKTNSKFGRLLIWFLSSLQLIP
ncbi:hypothetical protein EDB19DRAFT_1897095 [Suillus lakei]|nr:hypothetical protein EDB19DRAFT_1897095 [Suillus lakei]